MNKLLKYGFFLGKIYVLEEEMLTGNDFERLLEAKSLTETMQIIAESYFGSFLTSLRNENNIEEALENYLESFFALIDELDSATISKYFRFPYDLANLKLLFTSHPLNSKLSNLGLINPSLLKSAVEKKAYNRLADLFETEEETIKKLAEADILTLEQKLQKYNYDTRLALAKKSDFSLLATITRIEIDMANIKIWQNKIQDIRSKLIDGGQIEKTEFVSGDIERTIAINYPILSEKFKKKTMLTDKDLDLSVIIELAKYKYEPTNANRVITFLRTKELEVKNIRLVLYTALNRFKRDFAEKNLRYLYV